MRLLGLILRLAGPVRSVTACRRSGRGSGQRNPQRTIVRSSLVFSWCLVLVEILHTVANLDPVAHSGDGLF